MSLHDKDLNTLVLFETIWEERNLHRAAEKLYISQPAISHALKKMREQFNDPLFVRSSGGVSPTDFSASIADEVKALLQRTEAIYSKGSNFIPKECDRTLYLSFGDYFSLSLVKPFFARIEKEAPHLKVICYPDYQIYKASSFERGKLHIGITGFFDVDLNRGFHSQVLVDDFVNCVARKNHPIFKTDINLADYLDYEHVFVSVAGDSSGAVDSLLKKKKKKRRVTKVVPSFFAAAELMEKTNIILTGPSAICESMRKTHGLKTFDAPFSTIEFPVKMYWHQRCHEDPMVKWVREILAEVGSTAI